MQQNKHKTVYNAMDVSATVIHYAIYTQVLASFGDFVGSSGLRPKGDEDAPVWGRLATGGRLSIGPLANSWRMATAFFNRAFPRMDFPKTVKHPIHATPNISLSFVW